MTISREGSSGTIRFLFLHLHKPRTLLLQSRSEMAWLYLPVPETLVSFSGERCGRGRRGRRVGGWVGWHGMVWYAIQRNGMLYKEMVVAIQTNAGIAEISLSPLNYGSRRCLGDERAVHLSSAQLAYVLYCVEKCAVNIGLWDAAEAECFIASSIEPQCLQSIELCTVLRSLLLRNAQGTVQHVRARRLWGVGRAKRRACCTLKRSTTR